MFQLQSFDEQIVTKNSTIFFFKVRGQSKFVILKKDQVNSPFESVLSPAIISGDLPTMWSGYLFNMQNIRQ